MPNPGSFRGTRFDFMVSQKEEWARAVEEEYATDMLSTIQRRYFRRYPIDLPHDVEPTAEHLASVDDDGPDVELNTAASTNDLVVPMTGHPPVPKGELIRFRKTQIQRWLAYQYAKDHAISSKGKDGLENPYIGFFARLSGKNLAPPRKRSDVNTWRTTPGARVDIETEFKLQVQQAIANNNPIPSRDFISKRDAIARSLFKKLPEAEQKAWAAKATADAIKAKEEHERALKAPPSTDPEARQRAIETLPEAIMPVLDYVCEATGLKVTMMAAGPEPARGGQISVISIHSGTTGGDVPLNFGQFQPDRYKNEVVPFFGKFIKECFSPAECRSRALSSESGFVPLSELEPANDRHPNALGTGMPNTFVHPVDTSATLWDGIRMKTIDHFSTAHQQKKTMDVSMTDGNNPFPFKLNEDSEAWAPTGSETNSSPPSPVITPRTTPEPEQCEDKNGVHLRRCLPPPCLIISPHGFVEYTESASEEERSCRILVLPGSQVVNSGGYTTIHSPPLPTDSTPIDPALLFERTPYFMTPNAATQATSSHPNPAPPLPASILNGIIRAAIQTMPLTPMPQAAAPQTAQSQAAVDTPSNPAAMPSEPSVGANPTPNPPSKINPSTTQPAPSPDKTTAGGPKSNKGNKKKREAKASASVAPAGPPPSSNGAACDVASNLAAVNHAPAPSPALVDPAPTATGGPKSNKGNKKKREAKASASVAPAGPPPSSNGAACDIASNLAAVNHAPAPSPALVDPAPTATASQPQPGPSNPSTKRTRDNLSVERTNVLEDGLKRPRKKSQKALALEMDGGPRGRGRGRPKKVGPEA